MHDYYAPQIRTCHYQCTTQIPTMVLRSHEQYLLHPLSRVLPTIQPVPGYCFGTWMIIKSHFSHFPLSRLFVTQILPST